MILLNEVIDRCPCYLTIQQTKHFDITYERYATSQKELNNNLKHLIIITVTLNKDSSSTTKIYNL